MPYVENGTIYLVHTHNVVIKEEDNRENNSESVFFF